MKLYIDVLFAVNVWMNMGLLTLTGIWLKYKKRGFFLFLGASIGGLGSCFLAAIPVFPRWAELLFTYLFTGPVMCRTAFGKHGGRGLLREVFSLSVISIFVGGFLNQLYFHTGAGYVMRELLIGRSAQGGSVLILLLLATVSFLAGKELFFFWGMAGKRRENLLQVTLRNGERQTTLTALLDTGNCLYEPVTKKPVSIVEKEAFRLLFPEKEEDQEGFFLIPYHSIGGEGFLKGRCLSEMAAVGEDGVRHPFADPPFFVALKEGSLSVDGGYQMILHGDFAKYKTQL
ncbi:MAG: sigma-E processing peptidase SpoIIGA [Lachnospiraceae bacterium]|nr:sigma-E processing peptidase SpoIIGA [Lachnospiraceae bacterium]